MNRLRISRLALVTVLVALFPLAMMAEVTLVVTTASSEPVTASVVTPEGKTLAATGGKNGIAYLTLSTSGSHTLTVSSSGQREVLKLDVPRAGTLSVFFDPKARQKLTVQPLTHGEAITVTAPKREELLQRVPMSIDALPMEAIESQGSYDFTDLARSIPNVSVVDRGPTQTEIVMRGISPMVGASTIGFHVDGLSLSSTFNQPSMDLFDVERVEVLRGPQGTLYGESSMGGNINIITNKADSTLYEQKFDLSSSATRAGGENYQLNGMVNVPLVKDRLALRIVGHTGNQSGWIDNPTLGLKDINDSRNQGLRVSTRWVASERSVLTLTAEYHREKIGGQSEVNALLGDLMADKQVAEPQNDRVNLYSLEYDYDLGWSDLTLIGGTMLRDADVQLDMGLGPDYPAFYTSGQQVVSSELRLASKRNGPLTWVGGAFFKRWGRDNVLWSDGFPVAPGFVTRYVAAVQFDTDTAALFGEANWAFTDKLTGTVGMRAFQQKEHDVTLNHLPEIGYVVDDANLSKTFRDLSPKFGLSWQRTPASLFFANVAKGYRAGGTNVLHASNPGAPLSYDADVVWSYEVGMKTTSHNGRVVTNAALFHSDWNNLQILGTPHNQLLGYTTNAGRAQSRGLELEVRARATDALQLEMSGTWANSTLKEAAQGGEPGNWLPFVPRYAYSAGGRYEKPFGQRRGVVRADYSWRGKTYREVTNAADTVMDAYSLTSVRAGLESDFWAAYLFVNNVFDTRADLDRNASLYYFRNQPRTIGVNVRVTR